MSAFPKTFSVESAGASGVSEIWVNHLIGKECAPISMAIPPEFDGPGGTYSPEDLYAMALMNCYLATFKVIAEKSKLQYENILGSATLYVDKGEEIAPWMERIEITIILTGAKQTARALTILEKTKAHCMILNSVKTKIDFEFQVKE
ncbi:MAG: OsmC family protein [Bacteriovorax sp.]|nr:OsmC family protein [Bacteriovorax sp.]